MPAFPGLLVGLLLSVLGCEDHAGPTSPAGFTVLDAVRILSDNETRWNDSARRYGYRYAHHTGLYASTRNGACEVGEIVSCEGVDGTGEPWIGQEPGRLQRYFDKMKAMGAALSLDSAERLGENAYRLSRWVRVDDTTVVPQGYSVWFDPGLGSIDSVFFYPFGETLRVKSLELRD